MTSPADTVEPARANLAERAAWVLLAIGAWSVLALAAWLHPDARGYGTHQQLGMPPCGFAAATGIPCPGCGLTTSFAHMAHGHFLAAFGAHLMGPPLFLCTAAMAVYAVHAVARAKPLVSVLETRAAAPALALTAATGLLTFGLRVAHVMR